MADKKLFEQDLKTSFGGTDRIALGIPGQEGCDNMLMSIFIDLIKNDNIASGTFTDANLTAGIWEYVHEKGTLIVELILYDGDGIKQSVDGMMQLIDEDTIQVDFGGSITGIWTYIFKWWNL